MAAPQFISTDVATIVQEMVAQFETTTGRTLQPAQVERLLIDMVAYREGLLRSAIQYAATQNLVSFSSAPYLDYLGELVGVSRLDASPAEVAITFALVPGHTGVTIPAGLRVTTTDAKATFATKAATNVNAGVTTVVVTCACLDAGVVGNGYTAGTVSVILDPQAYLVSATNAATTAGGADAEDDEALRQRIRLAPGQFNTAGSTKAYQYWAFTAHPGIIDVAVISPNPGEVAVYPLMDDGNVTPQLVLDAVNAALTPDQVRPICDLVTVTSPTRLTYTLNIELIVYNTADNATVEAAVTEALEAFVLANRQKLGRDIIGEQIIDVCQVAGVYKTILLSWSDIIVDPTAFAVCTGITVSIIGNTQG